MIFEILFYGLGFLILALTAIIILKHMQFEEKSKKINENKIKFQWHFDKLLLAYKVKVLKEEIRLRKVSMEELNEIINEALGTKFSRKHVLDEVEEQVKGEVKKASLKSSKGGD